jgi:hypothetical protein
LLEAPKDEEILWQAAAHANSNAAAIAALDTDWLSAEAAQERALGIAILRHPDPRELR